MVGKKKIEVVEKADKSLTDAWRIEISKLSAEDLFNHATVEMYHGGVFPTKETFCGACFVDAKGKLLTIEELYSDYLATQTV